MCHIDKPTANNIRKRGLDMKIKVLILVFSLSLVIGSIVFAGVSQPMTYSTGSGQKIQCWYGNGGPANPTLYAGEVIRTCSLVTPTQLPIGSGAKVTAGKHDNIGGGPIELFPNGTLRAFYPYKDEYYYTRAGQNFLMTRPRVYLFSDGTLESGTLGTPTAILTGSGQKLSCGGTIKLNGSGHLVETSWLNGWQTVKTGGGIDVSVLQSLQLYDNGTIKYGYTNSFRGPNVFGKKGFCYGYLNWDPQGKVTSGTCN
jgi:hypothetical protein